MGGVQASLIALITASTIFASGWFGIHLARAGFDYMSSRGNPRARAQAHESIRDNLIGFALVIGASVFSAFIVTTIQI